MGELPPIERVKDRLSRSEAKVADALIAAGPDGLHIVDLTAALFEEPRTDEASFKVATKYVSRLRSKLEPHGYHIPRGKGPDMAHYRIVPAEVGA